MKTYFDDLNTWLDGVLLHKPVLDDYIDAWHLHTKTTLSLQQWLGLDEGYYRVYVEQGSSKLEAEITKASHSVL